MRRAAWAARPIFRGGRTHLALLCAAACALLAPGQASPARTPHTAATTRAAAPLPTRLAQALAVPHVNHSRSGVVAVDLETGAVVFRRNAALSLAPASTEKLPVAFALLTRLGPSYRIRTDVVSAGGIDGATLHGDLYLRGHGDPTLSTAGLRSLAQQLRGLGIGRVAGAVVGDESYFDARRTAPGWKASYFIWESPPLSALTVDRARYRGRTSREPALAAAAAFKAVLRSAGIAVTGRALTGRAPADAVEVATVDSPPLLQILRAVNADSDNFTAEILLKHLGAAVAGKGTTAAGASVVRTTLAEAGVPLAGVRIADGSGLSLLDRLTADALVALLGAAWDDPLLRPAFVSTLAVAGKTGTLRRRLRSPPAAGQVFAKTGTTRRSSALSGYVGDRYAFAVVQNGPPLSSWWARRAQDRFVTALARE